MKEYDQLTPQEKNDLHNNFLQEPDSFYEKAETDQMKKALKKNYKERFLTMTRLMKLSLMLSRAKITYNDLPENKKV